MDLIFEKRFYRWLSLHPALIKFDARRTMGHDEKQTFKNQIVQNYATIRNFDLTALCEAFFLQQKNCGLEMSQRRKEIFFGVNFHHSSRWKN